uniref:Gap junction protein n=1 Tax=Serinus canaria TaxID=9135 RepID=A0A8C9MZM1_SERCA
MGEWGFLSSLLDAVQEHSPMVGRFWLVVMLLFRILVLATVGSDVFEDEQEEFVCNTQQPGCKPVCYDAAFPISHYRFLVFHVVVLSAPAALFVIFAVHQAAKPGRGGAPGQRARRLQPFYVGSVVARIAAELGFLLGQALLYGFRVQPLFVCRRRPCPHRVDCFVSRPTEKTVFIHFYFVVGLVSALLSLAELAHLLRAGRWGRTQLCLSSPIPPRTHHGGTAGHHDNCQRSREASSASFISDIINHMLPGQLPGCDTIPGVPIPPEPCWAHGGGCWDGPAGPAWS